MFSPALFLMALDHLWQSSLFALFIMLAAPVFRHQNARIRFWLWFAASAKFLIPFALLSSAGEKLALYWAAPSVSLPFYLDPAMVQMTAAPFTQVAASSAPAMPAFGWPTFGWLIFGWQGPAGALWLAGTAVFAARWAHNWWKMRALLRASEAVPIRSRVPVCITALPVQPALVGVIRPQILLPRTALTDLPDTELEAVLAHEVCHWRRGDHLWTLVHRIVEILFWFHPLVWWLGGRLNREREHACDEAVLAGGYAPKDYAASLISVCALHLRRPGLVAGEMTGADLKARIDAILACPPALPLGFRRKALIGVAALTCAALPLGAGFAASGNIADSDIIHNTQHPPSEALLRKAITELTGAAASRAVSAKIDTAFPARQFRLHRYLIQWGALKTLTFSHTDTQGDDQYEAVFAQGRAYFVVHPAPDGHTLNKMGFHVMVTRDPAARPHPGTQDAVRGYIMATEKGVTDYSAMTPDFASVARHAGPVTRHYLQKWGPFRSITFLDQDDNGLDVFRVRFQRGWSDWRIAPLSNGKIWGMNFWGVSTRPAPDGKGHT